MYGMRVEKWFYTLKLQELLGEWFQTNQIGTDNHGRRVMGAVVIRSSFIVRVIPFFVTFAELRQSVGCLGSHGPTEVTESGRVVKIQLMALAVS